MDSVRDPAAGSELSAACSQFVLGIDVQPWAEERARRFVGSPRGQGQDRKWEVSFLLIPLGEHWAAWPPAW